MDQATLSAKLAQYHFYNTIDLGGGIKTPGQPVGPKQQAVLQLLRSMDLTGKRAVDLGCANGLFALEAERQGAGQIFAVEHIKRYLDPLEEVIIPHLNSRVQAVNENMLNFTASKYGQFDCVIFAGLLYHLRYPFSALQIVRDLTRHNGTVILETGIMEDFGRKALLHCPSRGDSPRGSQGGACSFFNEKALEENLAAFGFRVSEKVFVIPRWRRAAKKMVGLFRPRYKISNVILRCERDKSLDDAHLMTYYEATNPLPTYPKKNAG